MTAGVQQAPSMAAVIATAAMKVCGGETVSAAETAAVVADNTILAGSASAVNECRTAATGNEVTSGVIRTKCLFIFFEGLDGRVRRTRLPDDAGIAHLREAAQSLFGQLLTVVAAGDFYMATKAKDAIGDVICYELMSDDDVYELQSGSTVVLKVRRHVKKCRG